MPPNPTVLARLAGETTWLESPFSLASAAKDG